MRHKANDGVVYAIRAWFKYTILHCLQWYKLVLRTRLSTAAAQYLVPVLKSTRINVAQPILHSIDLLLYNTKRVAQLVGRNKSTANRNDGVRAYKRVDLLCATLSNLSYGKLYDKSTLMESDTRRNHKPTFHAVV